MARTYTIPPTADVITDRRAVSAIGVAFFALATILGAYVRIPVPASPVPITLQTLFVVLAGALLGKRLAAASMVAYGMLNAALIPGPTGGYFFGFIAAAYLVGALIERGVPAVPAFAAGSVAVYACGAAWLVGAYHLDLGRAIAAGVLPFIPGDCVKLVIAAAVYAKTAKRAREIFAR